MFEAQLICDYIIVSGVRIKKDEIKSYSSYIQPPYRDEKGDKFTLKFNFRLSDKYEHTLTIQEDLSERTAKRLAQIWLSKLDEVIPSYKPRNLAEEIDAQKDKKPLRRFKEETLNV